MSTNNNKQRNGSDVAGGMAFVGAILIGVGLGLAYVHMAVSVMVGLGVGFILFGLTKALYRD